MVYEPYAIPMLLDWENGTRSPLFRCLGLYQPEWMSVLYSVVIGWVGLRLFRRTAVR